MGAQGCFSGWSTAESTGTAKNLNTLVAFISGMKQAERKRQGNISPRYKSWGEEQIARLLDLNRMDYRYEHPVAVIDRGQTRIWYPDFWLPQYGMIIEYFGMVGDAGYDQRAGHKIEVYRQTGIDGLFLTRDSLRGDWPARILGEIEGILQARLDRFYRFRKRAGGVQIRPLSIGSMFSGP